MVTKVQITFDAADPYVLASWWAELLGYEVENDNDIVSGLLERGVVSQDEVMRIDGLLYFKDAVAATASDGSAPRFYFQRVPEAKAGKNRVHLDVPVPPENLESEVERLTTTGASLVEYRSHPGHRWAVMQDPEGNEFCLH